ncbi:hypothetical protein HZA41_03390 [Candidatus Peregrinibacteria bacterium]|nr:hypothetical protein [Candidatus Peregrinibacteria bacterium]
MRHELLVVSLPKPHGNIAGCWYNGYPIHKGLSEHSLNMATLYAHQNGIIPDQQKLVAEYEYFIDTLKKNGFTLHVLPFPDALNTEASLDHDAVFIRDAGLAYRQYWIKARFSCKERAAEADIFAPIIAEKFKKEIIELPKDAFLETGESIYVESREGTFYFGGIARSNKLGHEAVMDVIRPDHSVLVESEGYHLDTVLAPVISGDNTLKALLVNESIINAASLAELRKLGIELIPVDVGDSSGTASDLGTYAINMISAPGILIGSSRFSTPGIEELFEKWGISHIVTPLSYFRYAGGSAHCLTNEI